MKNARVPALVTLSVLVIRPYGQPDADGKRKEMIMHAGRAVPHRNGPGFNVCIDAPCALTADDRVVLRAPRGTHWPFVLRQYGLVPMEGQTVRLGTAFLSEDNLEYELKAQSLPACFALMDASRVGGPGTREEAQPVYLLGLRR